MHETEFPRLIQELYAIVGKLEAMFLGRHFTPDGHLVGSIGEALASHYYGVALCTASTQGYDGLLHGRQIEVKATQGKSVALYSCPEHLLVFKLLPDGTFEEHYNGPGAPVWALLATRKPTKNGQQQVSLTALRTVMAASVTPSEVIQPCRPLPLSTRRNSSSPS
jgi:hypothetical protein